MMDIYPIRIAEDEEGVPDNSAEIVGTVVSLKEVADRKSVV